MKRLAVAIFALIPYVLGAQQQIVVGVFLHSPYVERSTRPGEFSGAGTLYMDAILGIMGYKAKYVLQPFPRILQSLSAGEIDAAFDLIKTADREGFLHYPEHPAMSAGPVLIVRKDSSIREIRSVEDLKGLKIGYIKDSTIPDFMAVQGVYSFDLITGEDWGRQNLLKLLAKRCDAVLDLNPYSYMIEAKRMGMTDSIRVVPLPVEPTNFYVVFSKKSPHGQKLLIEYNKAKQENKIDYQAIILDSIE